jgi:hypothetical protein
MSNTFADRCSSQTSATGAGVIPMRVALVTTAGLVSTMFSMAKAEPSGKHGM